MVTWENSAAISNNVDFPIKSGKGHVHSQKQISPDWINLCKALRFLRRKAIRHISTYNYTHVGSAYSELLRTCRRTTENFQKRRLHELLSEWWQMREGRDPALSYLTRERIQSITVQNNSGLSRWGELMPNLPYMSGRDTNWSPSYTHYYSINTDSPEWKAIWPQFVDDVHKIISRCDVALAGSAQEGVGREVPPLVDLKEGIYLNGVDEDSHEPFAIGCKNHYGFTKTAFKPYDKVVTCILLRAYMLAPSACGIL